ncbi:ABC transporter permease [Candidatus Acetothermia bacterium]|nr:ABC transporter permease [Candidatus Acetothermia bacterium]
MYRVNLFQLLQVVSAILIALIIGLIIIFVVSEEPFRAAYYLLFGPLTRIHRSIEWIHMTIPIIFTGLAVSLVFQAKQFNIGAEGQFLVGAAGATFVALHFPPIGGLHILIIALAAMAGGTLWGAVPGLLKARFAANELVSSLMMNFIGFFLALYLVNHYFRDVQAGFMVSYRFPLTAWLPDLTIRPRLHSGIILAVIAVGLIWYFLYRTKWGYEIRMVGMNLKFAEFGGINVQRVVFYVQALSGGVAGLAGAVELMGVHHRFLWTSMPGLGFDGIIVAILARNHPLGLLFAALFIGYLRTAARLMERRTDVAAEVTIIMQAVVILLVTAEAFLQHWQRRRKEREALLDG